MWPLYLRPRPKNLPCSLLFFLFSYFFQTPCSYCCHQGPADRSETVRPSWPQQATPPGITHRGGIGGTKWRELGPHRPKVKRRFNSEKQAIRNMFVCGQEHMFSSSGWLRKLASRCRAPGHNSIRFSKISWTSTRSTRTTQLFWRWFMLEWGPCSSPIFLDKKGEHSQADHLLVKHVWHHPLCYRRTLHPRTFFMISRDFCHEKKNFDQCDWSPASFCGERLLMLPDPTDSTFNN